MAFQKAVFKSVVLHKEDGNARMIDVRLEITDTVKGVMNYRIKIDGQNMDAIINAGTAAQRKAALKAKVKEIVKPMYVRDTTVVKEQAEQGKPSDLTDLD